MIARSTRLLSPLAVAAVAALAACSGTGSDATSTPAGQDVTVRVTPEAPRLAPGESVAFAAAVTGTADARVTWTVVEAGGGTIDATGRYVAPGTPGGFHVRAASVANPAVAGQAVVTVVAPVAVAISPSAPTVAAGGTVAFTATVTNATDTAVTWSVQGTGCGTISAGGVYTAPPAAASCTVVATSRADPARTASTVVTVTAPPPPAAVVVSVSPSPAAVDACQALQLTATVTNATNRAVTWSVQEGAAGGTVDATGVYVAPATPGAYHVVATSVQDPARSAVVTVTVQEKVLSVAVSPPSATVAQGATVQFTATVTTTCGAFASVASVTAP